MTEGLEFTLGFVISLSMLNVVLFVFVLFKSRRLDAFYYASIEKIGNYTDSIGINSMKLNILNERLKSIEAQISKGESTDVQA